MITSEMKSLIITGKMYMIILQTGHYDRILFPTFNMPTDVYGCWILFRIKAVPLHTMVALGGEEV
jgi:hypothetical protein